MSMAQLPPPGTEWDVLPCGCRVATAIVDGEPMFYFDPHDSHCQYFIYALEEAKRQDYPIYRVEKS